MSCRLTRGGKCKGVCAYPYPLPNELPVGALLGVQPWGGLFDVFANYWLLHVPLYGWGSLPLDLAVGVFLGVLRALTGSLAAPAAAHVLADLAGWWLR